MFPISDITHSWNVSTSGPIPNQRATYPQEDVDRDSTIECNEHIKEREGYRQKTHTRTCTHAGEDKRTRRRGM